MTVIEELEKIADRMVESGFEIFPDNAILSLYKYKQLISELNSDHPEGLVVSRVYLRHCILNITVNTGLPSDHLSIGRMTLNDIIIEDILLDDETYQDTFHRRSSS